MKQPQNVQVIGICLLIGGIFAIMTAMVLGLSTLCLYLPWIYGMVAGILAIIQGVKLLGSQSFGAGVPTTVAILLIVNIINADMFGMIAGVLVLVLAQDEDTKSYLEGVEILD